MHRCPFLDEHPDLFLLTLSVLFIAYVVYYGLFCLILYLLMLNHRLRTNTGRNVDTPYFSYSSLFFLPKIVTTVHACIYMFCV